MADSSKKDYQKLKNDLEKYQNWPSEYIYKFIIVNETKKKEEERVVSEQAPPAAKEKEKI